MKKSIIYNIFFVFAETISAQSQSVVGKWKTIGDETRQIGRIACPFASL